MKHKNISLIKKAIICSFITFGFNQLSAQTTISATSFAGSSGPFTNNSNLQYSSDYSSIFSRPSNLPYGMNGSSAAYSENNTVVLETGNISLNNYCNNSLSFRLAAWSYISSSNGVDNGDFVRVEISTNGGSSFQNILEVKGQSNAYWHYTTGTATASTAFHNNSTPTTFTPSSGGNRTSDGYSTVTITDIPNSSQLRVRITMECDNNERWTIDDFMIQGTARIVPIVSISTPSFNVCSSTSVTFSSTVNSAGATPTYQWRVNGNNVS